MADLSLPGPDIREPALEGMCYYSWEGEPACSQSKLCGEALCSAVSPPLPLIPGDLGHVPAHL